MKVSVPAETFFFFAAMLPVLYVLQAIHHSLCFRKMTAIACGWGTVLVQMIVGVIKIKTHMLLNAPLCPRHRAGYRGFADVQPLCDLCHTAFVIVMHR